MPEIAWNGIGLETPSGWEPSSIERDGLTLAASDRPVCELKWSVIRGSFSFDKHIRKLTRANRDAAVRAVEGDEAPPAWSGAAARLEQSGLRVQSFQWQSGRSRALGAALHHPATGLACLVQFFVESAADEDAAAEVLATLRDHTGGKTRPWAMFGLKARVPADFVLDTFSFKPGHYRVAWWRPASGRAKGRVPTGKGPGTRLDFERFAPASVLLKTAPLETWVRTGLTEPPPKSLAVQAGPDRADWRGAARTSWLRRLLRREVHACGRAWGADNVILAVTAGGVVPLSETVFNDICGSFALVPEEAA